MHCLGVNLYSTARSVSWRLSACVHSILMNGGQATEGARARGAGAVRAQAGPAAAAPAATPWAAGPADAAGPARLPAALPRPLAGPGTGGFAVAAAAPGAHAPTLLAWPLQRQERGRQRCPLLPPPLPAGAAGAAAAWLAAPSPPLPPLRQHGPLLGLPRCRCCLAPAAGRGREERGCKAPCRAPLGAPQLGCRAKFRSLSWMAVHVCDGLSARVTSERQAGMMGTTGRSAALSGRSAHLEHPCHLRRAVGLCCRRPRLLHSAGHRAAHLHAHQSARQTQCRLPR